MATRRTPLTDSFSTFSSYFGKVSPGGTQIASTATSPMYYPASPVSQGGQVGGWTAVSPMSTERSQSPRGRDDQVFRSSGRGGAGNMRRTSASREGRSDIVYEGPDDFSSTRGREILPSHKVTHSGRGGAGNVRNPSTDPERDSRDIADERQVIVQSVYADAANPHSYGRGGLGNISNSRSRSRGPANGPTNPQPAVVHASGRGGYGNIIAGASSAGNPDLGRLDEEERRAVAAAKAGGGVHSTGRGGAANLTKMQTPKVEQPPHEYSVPHGRGGMGNIIFAQTLQQQQQQQQNK